MKNNTVYNASLSSPISILKCLLVFILLFITYYFTGISTYLFTVDTAFDFEFFFFSSSF